MRKYCRYYVVLLVILFFQLAMIVYFGFQKENLHIDEYFSYYSTSDNDFYIGLQDSNWNNIDIMIEKCIVTKEHRFDYQNVYEMEAKDVHPPLYYYCLHTVCSLFPGSFTKWTGLGLNILFFIISYYLLEKITWILFERWDLVLAINFFYGFNPAVISGVMFIRMYMLLAVFILLYIYIHLKILQKCYGMNIKQFLYIMLCAFGGFLTHYYFIIFAGVFSTLFAISMLLASKKIRNSIYSFSAFAIGIVFSVLYYPASIRHILFDYRGEGAQNAFFDLNNTLYRLRYFMNLISKITFNDRLKETLLLCAIGILTIIIISISKKEKLDFISSITACKSGYIIIVISTIVYFFVVSKTALVNEKETIRYILPVHSLMFLILISTIYFLLNYLSTNLKLRNISLIFLSVVGFLLNLLGTRNGNILYLYPDSLQRKEFAASHSDASPILIHSEGGWMWEIAGELNEYSQFYSVSQEHLEELDDEKVVNADKLVAYIDHTDENTSQNAISVILKYNQNLQGAKLIFETQFFDIYFLE